MRKESNYMTHWQTRVIRTFSLIHWKKEKIPKETQFQVCGMPWMEYQSWGGILQSLDSSVLGASENHSGHFFSDGFLLLCLGAWQSAQVISWLMISSYFKTEPYLKISDSEMWSYREWKAFLSVLLSEEIIKIAISSYYFIFCHLSVDSCTLLTRAKFFFNF
jgi:hypothetical protein